MNITTAATRRPAVTASLAVLALVSLTTTLTCRADEQTEAGRIVRSISVDYSDLDLTDPKGLKILYSRLRRAADRACGGAPSVRESWAKPIYKECYEQALTDAVLNIDSATLRAMHDSEAHRSTAG